MNFFQEFLRKLIALTERNEGQAMSKEMRDRFRSPSVNVDGTPMVGRHDTHGRGYGSGSRDGS